MNSRQGVHRICDLDIEKYSCITPDIPVREVIITDERIAHIRSHHPGHFEAVAPFLRAASEEPDYILEDAPNTGLILKAFQADGTSAPHRYGFSRIQKFYHFCMENQ